MFVVKLVVILFQSCFTVTHNALTLEADPDVEASGDLCEYIWPHSIVVVNFFLDPPPSQENDLS